VALTYSTDIPQYVGTQKVVTGTITFDSSYPTGGESVTVADLGLVRLDHLELDGDDGYVLVWDRSTTSPKILAYWVDTTVDGAPLAQVTNATNLSSVVSRFRAYGA
jgi:hypothetical protein